MQQVFGFKSVLLILFCGIFWGCCTHEPQRGAISKSPSPDQSPSLEPEELSLNIQAPNDVVLRSSDVTEDPLTTVRSLRLVFYQATEQAYRVAYIRDLNSVENDLNDIRVKLPRGAYKLVVIANPTTRLIERTRENSPLELLTKGDFQSSSHLRMRIDGTNTRLQVSMLNAQGPVSIAPESFEPSNPPIKVQLEPALARVLVFGTPEILRGNKGSEPVRYTVVNLTREMTYLRMLNKLEDGTPEQLDDESNRTRRYASCKLWDTWVQTAPSSTEGIGTLSAELYKQADYWTLAQAKAEDFGPLLNTGSLYTKEGVVPPNAYLKGLVPTAVIAFPYIPLGLTLDSDEGWIEYNGQVYSERQIKEMINKQREYASSELKSAIERAGITPSSFSEGFSKENINFYHKGVNYYGVPIRHFAAATEASSYGRYGVVRGNEYRIKLVRISQMGSPTPIVYQGNLAPIDENLPLNHNMSVAPLEVRNQEVEL